MAAEDRLTGGASPLACPGRTALPPGILIDRRPTATGIIQSLALRGRDVGRMADEAAGLPGGGRPRDDQPDRYCLLGLPGQALARRGTLRPIANRDSRMSRNGSAASTHNSGLRRTIPWSIVVHGDGVRSIRPSPSSVENARTTHSDSEAPRRADAEARVLLTTASSLRGNWQES